MDEQSVLDRSELFANGLDHGDGTEHLTLVAHLDDPVTRDVVQARDLPAAGHDLVVGGPGR